MIAPSEFSARAIKRIETLLVATAAFFAGVAVFMYIYMLEHGLPAGEAGSRFLELLLFPVLFLGAARLARSRRIKSQLAVEAWQKAVRNG